MAPTNQLTTHGNDKTMNLNSLILTNIQSSPYFKVNLYELKTYHEVIDEIYYKVGHLEPWEKGSRKTAGQTGMCGGVRGVGAGGIVSSAFCLLYKLFTLKLTKKQVIGLITHTDSPYIRGLGFMYIRYTQPPGDLWDWYEDYLDDEEEVDVKAGGGHTINMGEMLRQFLTKLEWYSTLFPRIPVPIQKDIQKKMAQWDQEHNQGRPAVREEPVAEAAQEDESGPAGFGEAERISQLRTSVSPKRSKGGSERPSPPFDISKEIESERERQHNRERESRDRHNERDRRRDHRGDHDRKDHKHRSRSPKDRNHKSHRSRSRDRKRARSEERPRSKERRKSRDKQPPRSKDKKRSSKDKERRSPPPKSRDHHKKARHRSRSRDRNHREEDSYERDLQRERARQRNEKKNGH